MACRLLFYLLLNICCSSIWGCTIFNSKEGGKVLAGNNEDWHNTNNSIHFVPSGPTSYGYLIIKVGYNGAPYGGMNDQGLFFDWCALTKRNDIKFPDDRLKHNGILCNKILGECADVDDVIELYKKYNDPWLISGHIMVADKKGASAIIEWGKDSLMVIRKSDKFQVMTNFNITNPRLAGWYPCWRYDKATNLLQKNPVHSISLYRDILKAVNQFGENQTIYSNIYELDNGLMHSYFMHKYDRSVEINLANELAKGYKCYLFPEIICDVEVKYPLNNQTVPSGTLNFLWQGNASRYELSFSEDSSFLNNKLNIPNKIIKSKVELLPVGIICFVLLFLFLRKKQVFLFTALLFMVTCSEDEFYDPINKPPVTEKSFQINNLKPNTKYYWRISAYNSAGFKTDTKVNSFVVQ